MPLTDVRGIFLGKMNKTLIKLLIGIALFIFLGFVFTQIYIYFVIAIVLTAILRPLTNYLYRLRFFNLRMPKWLSVIVAFLTLGIVISAFTLLFVPLISSQLEVISGINYPGLVDQLRDPVQHLEQFLISNGLTQRDPGFIMNDLKDSIISFASSIEYSSLFNSVIVYTGGIVVSVIAVLFITFFLLYEMGSLRNKVIGLVPNKYFELSISTFTQIEQLLSNYLVGLIFQMVAIFTLASIGLSIFGINYAITIALFAAVANLIPYLGPLIGAIFGIVVSLLGAGPEVATVQNYLWLTVKIVGVFAVVQITDNVILQPLIFSKSIKAHPLEIFVIIFAAAILAGIPGMIMAVPVYTILRVSVKEFYAGYKQYRIFKL